jgi:conjugative transposon TraK protein
MLIENLEKKIKLSLLISALSIICGVITAGMGIYAGYVSSSEARKSIYVLSNDIPLLAYKNASTSHLEVEGRAIIKNFHRLFFTLPPDDEYMNKTISEALYLIDESGVRQRNALTEKGFYNHILSQSNNFSIICDSIQLDPNNSTFTYYGTQRIEGRSSLTRRQLITTGRLVPIPRSTNNPYGYLIVDYKTLSNSDIETNSYTK